MSDSLPILALIPARAGSKGIPHKNIRPLAGKPLMAWSIEQALASDYVDRVIVSTDSEEYAEIARQHGAEVPVLRPAEVSGDLSTDLEAFQHILNWLSSEQGWLPDICLHLRPTHPVRSVRDIDAVIELLVNDPSLDSVRSIAPAPETPFKMWFRSDDGLLDPVIRHPDLPEAHSMPRQLLPQTFLQNASLDAIRSRVIMQDHSMTGSRIYGYLMRDSFDIDNENQWQRAENWLLEDRQQ